MFNRKFFLFFSIAIIGLFSCFFIPKVNQFAWRVTSIIEFKSLKLLSVFFQNSANKSIGSENYLASHRGVFSKTVVENSKKSIIIAAEKGFHFIELDVSFSKEHFPIIFHDINLKSKTNFEGFTSEFYWRDIQKLSLSDNQRILSLQYFLSEYAHLFDGVILDIKGDDDSYLQKADSFCKVISEANISNKIFVIGVPFLVLSTIKKVNPKLKVGCENQGSLYNYFTGKDLVSLNYPNQFSYLEYIMAKKFGLSLIVWTVNEKQEIKKLRKFKGIIILTDLHNPNL